MNKNSVLFVIFLLTMIMSACSGANPQTEMMGYWQFISSNSGGNPYAYDLAFQENGSLIIQNTNQPEINYAVIAPGRMKVSDNNQSDVIQFSLQENELLLMVGDGTNRYIRGDSSLSLSPPQSNSPSRTDSTPEGETPTENSSIMEPTPTTPPAAPTSTPTANVPTATPAIVVGSNKLREVDGMPLMYVPAGKFIMGSTDNDPNAYAHEKPQHEVSVDAFWMDAFEVSNEMFLKFVEETGYQTQAEKQGYSYMYNSAGTFGKFNGVNWRHPLGTNTHYKNPIAVTHVNQFDAMAYCLWAGGRLPTEAEWEYAARGDDQRIYPWGNQFDSSLLQFNSRSGPADVSNFPGGASPFGILNMAGNVFEWTSDWYDSDYYAYATQINPLGPPTGEFCVVRGGGWTNTAKHVRTAHRDISKPDLMNHLLGFRCVMEP